MRCRHALSFEMYPPEYPSVRGMTLKPAHAAEPSPSLSLSLSPTPLTHLNPLCPRMVDPILGRTLLRRCIAFFRRSANQREPWSTTPFPFSLGRFTQTSCLPRCAHTVGVGRIPILLLHPRHSYLSTSSLLPILRPPRRPTPLCIDPLPQLPPLTTPRPFLHRSATNDPPSTSYAPTVVAAPPFYFPACSLPPLNQSQRDYKTLDLVSRLARAALQRRARKSSILDFSNASSQLDWISRCIPSSYVLFPPFEDHHHTFDPPRPLLSPV